MRFFFISKIYVDHKENMLFVIKFIINTSQSTKKTKQLNEII